MAEVWQTKLEESNALLEQAKGILANSDSTQEEKNNAGKMREDAQKLREEAELYKDIIGEARKTVELQQAAEVTTPNPVDTKEFKDWAEYLKAIWSKQVHQVEDERLEWFGKDQEREPGHQEKSMSGTAGADGGFLIPAQFDSTVRAVQAEDGIMRRLGATIIRLANRQVTLPVLDQTGTTAGRPHWFGGMRFYWKDEGALKTETEPKWREVTLLAKKLIGLTNVPDELLADSAISLADFLSGPMGFSGGIAWMEDYAFFNGVGGGQPLGVLNTPCLITEPRQTAGQFSYVDAINMYEHLLPSSRAAWVLSHSLLSQVIQMNGPSSNPSYVWQPNAREGIPGYLLGLPVYWTEKLPSAANAGSALLIDARYYLVGDRQATTIEATKFHRWAYDETSWRAVHRVDGQPWLSDVITYQDGDTEVSPFVALGDVSGS